MKRVINSKAEELKASVMAKWLTGGRLMSHFLDPDSNSLKATYQGIIPSECDAEIRDERL